MLLKFVMPQGMAISESSDQSILVSFGSEFDAESYRWVLRLFHSLQDKPVRGIRNLHPGYHSLLIEFDALLISHQAVAKIAAERKEHLPLNDQVQPKTIEIPVCYGEEFGPDLTDLAHLHSLSAPEVIDLHASETYTVYFLGFVPGFAYLGTVPERIATPRLPVPRKQVPAGSVGIADRQTGVYPAVTPGGWRLIGRSPLSLFNPHRDGSSLLEPGDLVRFLPISSDTFHTLAAR